MGLTRTPQDTLLIAFRNPIPERKALLVPLENPTEVVSGERKQARLGKPILLDLDGRGIRSIEYSETKGRYLIVAGSYEDKGNFQLYSWSGASTERPEPVKGVDLQSLRPEALVVYPEEKTKIQILSDDGDESVNGTQCKDKTVNPEDKGFRSAWVPI